MKAGLGQARYAQGRLGESAALLREAVAGYRALPRARWRMSDALIQLGQVLTHAGEFEEALAFLRESEAISREQLGENSYAHMRAVYMRAYALCLKGDYAEAARALDRAEQLCFRNFPDDRVSAANIYEARGMIRTRTGRAAEGEPFARRATELYRRDLLRGSNGITLARLHWAESLTAQRKYAEAEGLLLEAYRDASEVQGAGHWRSRQAARALAGLYEAWGKPDLAARYRAAAEIG
jgi:tetratricopeptide (TPR) repeat protein